MTHLYGLNSCFYDNCDKKNNNKRKRRKKTRKKTHLRRGSNLGPLSQHCSFTTSPRGLSHLDPAKRFNLNKTDVIITVNTSKVSLKHAKYFERNLKER